MGSSGPDHSKGIVRFTRGNWAGRLQAATGKPVESAARGRYVVVAIDCSGSMDSSDKMGQARRGASSFAEEAFSEGYRVGVVSFASEAHSLLSPQGELAKVKAAVESLSASGSTNMAAALNLAVRNLRESRGDRVTFLVSDGMPDNRENALDEAGRAREAGIDVMVLGTDDADMRFLLQLATRRELAVQVSSGQLESGMAKMAGMLPLPRVPKQERE